MPSRSESTGSMHPDHCYWLCVSPRSGSSLLCQVLAASGVSGHPQEYALADNMPAHAKPWGLSARWGVTDFGAYWARCLEEGTSPNGWFGMKMAPAAYLETFLAQVGALPEYSGKLMSADELVRDFFPDLRFVYLTRRDKLRQAISMVKALQVNLWTSEQRETHGIEPAGEPSYDRAAIDGQLRMLALAESAWQGFFTRWNVRPLTLVYEDDSQDPEATLARIMAYLRIDDTYEFDPTRVTLQRLADDTTEAWVERYWAERPLG